MKKLWITGLCALIIAISSCKIGKQHGSNTTFKTFEKDGQTVTSSSIENDTLSLFVEYAGRVVFSDTHTAITSISPNGYLKFRRNDKELEVSNENGSINFELSADGRKVRSSGGREQLILEAYKAIQYTDSLRRPVKKDTL